MPHRSGHSIPHRSGHLVQHSTVKSSTGSINSSRMRTVNTANESILSLDKLNNSKDSDDDKQDDKRSSQSETVSLVRQLWDSTISALEGEGSKDSKRETLSMVALQHKQDKKEVNSLPCPPIFHQLVEDINSKLLEPQSTFAKKTSFFRVKNTSRFKISKVDESILKPHTVNSTLANLVPNDKTFNEFFDNGKPDTKLSNKSWSQLEENMRMSTTSYSW
ncbi:unnamed protein product [Owenia fusiformis]|uniref:Uncharacterized protein n=1 Tax=Owenia fusiformis TaxID=6347 RepID=A0A8S4NUA8_OWEFU|nr:unnamed protein product [Owenia fusiformis]